MFFTFSKGCVIFPSCNTIKYWSTIFLPFLSKRQNIYFSIDTEVNSGLSQISNMDLFANIRNGLQARIQVGRPGGLVPPLKFNTLSFHVNQTFIPHFILPSL